MGKLSPPQAVPRLHSWFSLPDGRVRRRGLELVTQYARPGFAEETTDQREQQKIILFHQAEKSPVSSI